MKLLPRKERSKLLSRIFWDQKVDTGEILDMLEGRREEAGSVSEKNLIIRILTSYDWYTVQKLIAVEKINALLTDDILDGIYPKDLRDRYAYVREVLSR